MLQPGRHRAKRQLRLGFSPVHEFKLITFATPFFWAWWQFYDATLGRLIH